jgi:opacity protein-like surface antigen
VSHGIKEHLKRLAATTSAAAAASSAAASAVSDAVTASAASAASATSGSGASDASSDGGDRASVGLEQWFLGSPGYASRRMLVCEPASYRDGTCTTPLQAPCHAC